MDDVDNGGGCARIGAGVHGKSLYLPLNVAVSLKLLFKKILIKYISKYIQTYKYILYIYVCVSCMITGREI